MPGPGRGRRPVLVTLLVTLLLALAVSACSQLPDGGPVHLAPEKESAAMSGAPYFRPPGPVLGADRTEIARGFLTAMEANPFSVASARAFLTPEAARQWRPGNGTLVYEGVTVQPGSGGVKLRLSATHRLDDRGAWSPGAARTRTMRLRMVQEAGQWRIAAPPDAVMVGSAYFSAQFEPYSLYFYDRPERVLVPQVVYIPRGEQVATTLLRGLLQGPGQQHSRVLRTAFPPRTDLELGAVPSDSGTLEVPVGPQVLQLPPEQLYRAALQLAWTLRPVAGVRRVRLTVGGAPVPLPDGRTELSVDEGQEYSPTGLGASRETLGVRAGHVVTLADGAAEPVRGGLGGAGHLLSTVAMNRSGSTLAAVSQSRREVYVGAKNEPGPVRTVLTGARGLARPQYDLYGRLWLLDRGGEGARLWVSDRGGFRELAVPGITGSRATAFSLSPDGTRVAAVGPSDSEVTVADIERDSHGRALRAAAVRRVSVPAVLPDYELGPPLDVGWRTPSELAVLTGPVAGLSRVVLMVADGSPGAGSETEPDAFTGGVRSLLVNADPQLPLQLLDASGRLHRLDAGGGWGPAAGPRLVSAAYAH